MRHLVAKYIVYSVFNESTLWFAETFYSTSFFYHSNVCFLITLCVVYSMINCPRLAFGVSLHCSHQRRVDRFARPAADRHVHLVRRSHDHLHPLGAGEPNNHIGFREDCVEMLHEVRKMTQVFGFHPQCPQSACRQYLSKMHPSPHLRFNGMYSL